MQGTVYSQETKKLKKAQRIIKMYFNGYDKC